MGGNEIPGALAGATGAGLWTFRSVGAEYSAHGGVFARHAMSYFSAGLPCFPVDPRRKRPAVTGWQKPNRRKIAAWMARCGDADGLGVAMGAPSRLVEVDVDTAGDAPLAEALERFGDSPVTIRTASGKSKIWYRHAGEPRMIRPIPGLAVDVLGGGFTVAPPSWRDDLGAAYRFLTGGLADLDRLPTIRPGALDASTRGAAGVHTGERNNRLFRYAMAQARFCDDLGALEDVCTTWAAAMPDPLSLTEVRAVAASAWRYEASGRNFIGMSRPQVGEIDMAMDALKAAPDAFYLLALFRRYHANRGAFAIAPAAMSAAQNPPWHRTRIARARDMLIERGFLDVLSDPERGKHRAGSYRLKMPESGHNHLNIPPPSLEASAWVPAGAAGAGDDLGG